MDDLLLKLHKLTERANNHGGSLSESMLERYRYFVEHSEHGKDCSYARKCKDLFLTHDYDDTKKLFLEVLEMYRIIEGDGFGRDPTSSK